MKRPKVTCGAIILKANKILLTKRNTAPYKNYWCLPGGHLEWGETVKEAIKREVKEETGLDFQPKFWKFYDEILPKIKWHALALVFVGQAKGKIKIDKKEVKEWRFFSKKEIEKLKLAFITGQVLKDYFLYVKKNLTKK